MKDLSIYDQVNVWGKDDEFRLKTINAGNPKTICDLGCGTGRLTLLMAKEGTKVWAGRLYPSGCIWRLGRAIRR